MKQRFRMVVAIGFICLFFIKNSDAKNLTNPYLIFQKHYTSVGGLENLKAIKNSYTEGITEYDGLKGTFKEWEQKPLRYRREEDFTIIQQVIGDDGNFAWVQDTNGKTLVHRDEQTMTRRKLVLRLERYEHLDPTNPYFSLSFEGIQKVDQFDCYVVKISNTINQDVGWNFFDTGNFRLRKSIARQPDYETHTVYKDFRMIDGGIILPFYADTRFLPREKREISQVTYYQPNIEIKPSLFEIPTAQIHDFRFNKDNKTEGINFVFAENNIYLPVTINDESHYWIVDSGASMSVVDADYARRIGSKPKGRIKGFGFGENFDLSFVILPEYRINGLSIDSQTIFSMEDLANQFYEPDALGILGYDFLSRFVTKIDYSRQTISFYDPGHFSYSGPGEIIDAPLMYKTFSVPATLDGKYFGRWSIDLGAYNTSSHFPFAAKYGLVNRSGVETLSGGIVSAYKERMIQFDTFELGGFVIKKPLISVPQQKGIGAAAIGELAGNVGNSILRHFLIYLDYPQQRLIIEKGQQFNRIFPKDKSGMVIGRSKNGLPYVAFVAKHTPADLAGFKLGDTIRNIDGKNASDLGGIVAVKHLLRNTADTKYKFTIERDGKLKEIDLTLQELF